MMFKLLPLLFCTLFFFQKPANQLQVKINGVKEEKGHLLISVYNSINGFPDNNKKAFKNLQTVAQKSTIINLDNLPEGEYAIAVLHDANNDQKMNTNWIGIPKEGLGFSNDAMGLFGPPSFTKAKVYYKNGIKQIEIKLRYY